jgi:type II secretory pathway pseudopilin PulG
MKHPAKTISGKRRARQRGEQGYALIAIIGVIMFSLILTTAALPKAQFEMQREKEEEMLWRGQQIARALALYRQMRGTYPLDLKDLVNGVDIGVRKVRLLRPSALCDPMTPCEPGETNWRLVHPGDPLPKELYDAYVATIQKGTMALPPPNSIQDFPQLAQLGGGTTNLPGQSADTKLDGVIGPPTNPAGTPGAPGVPGAPATGSTPGLTLGDPDDKLKKQPIVGVVSQREGRMFRSYFGIEEYDHTLFFPGVPVLVGGFVNPLVLGSALASGSGPDQRCPGGGVFIDGRCWGKLDPGTIKRTTP